MRKVVPHTYYRAKFQETVQKSAFVHERGNSASSCEGIVFFICSSLPHSALMLAQRKRICGKVTEQNLNWGLQNWLSTLQRSPFFQHHFSKSTLKSALFPRLLCVGRMRVDMTMYGDGQAVRVATPSWSSTTSWASSSDKQAILKPLVNTNATTASSDSVRTFLLLRNSCFAFLQILLFSPCTTCNRQASWRNWLWWWWWRWVTRALPYWRLVNRSWANKKEKKTCPTLEDRVETSNLQIHSFFFVVAELHVSLKDTPPKAKKAVVICCKKKKRKNDGWNGWDRCGRSTIRGADWPQAATVTVRQPISARWLWRRRYSNMPPPFTKWKTFSGAPHQELSNDTKFERHRQC